MRTRLRGRHADGAGERLVGQLDTVREDDPAPLLIYTRDPQPRLGELVGQEPEARDERRQPPFPRPKFEDLDGEHVARLRALDVEGPADRVDVG